MGSGTTLFVCENLKRKFIGFDINSEMIDYVKKQMTNSSFKDYFIEECDVTNSIAFQSLIEQSLKQLGNKKVQFVIIHPPYMDVVKFTDKKNDLSQISNLSEFIKKFTIVIENTLQFLEKSRYFAIVIGDIYKNSEVIPLGFFVLNTIKQNFKTKLKGIIVKNIAGNRGKLGKVGIWKYRALKSDYYIFKHEYILVFKKEF